MREKLKRDESHSFPLEHVILRLTVSLSPVEFRCLDTRIEEPLC